MRREEGEQCRSKRHCFSVLFLKRKEKKRKENVIWKNLKMGYDMFYCLFHQQYLVFSNEIRDEIGDIMSIANSIEKLYDEIVPIFLMESLMDKNIC
jgi:hypothetical protein